jgi:hypothetical protein
MTKENKKICILFTLLLLKIGVILLLTIMMINLNISISYKMVIIFLSIILTSNLLSHFFIKLI